MKSMKRISPAICDFNPQGPVPEVSLSTEHPAHISLENALVTIVYTPDRHIVNFDDFTKWLDKHAKNEWENWEELVSHMLDGFYDVVLPKTVTIKLQVKKIGRESHCIKITQSQPN